MHCCSKAPRLHLLCCAQVRNITASIRLPPHNHQYLQRSVSDLAQGSERHIIATLHCIVFHGRIDGIRLLR